MKESADSTPPRTPVAFFRFWLEHRGKKKRGRHHLDHDAVIDLRPVDAHTTPQSDSAPTLPPTSDQTHTPVQPLENPDEQHLTKLDP